MIECQCKYFYNLKKIFTSLYKNTILVNFFRLYINEKNSLFEYTCTDNTLNKL